MDGEHRSFDPRNLRPLGPWALVRQDDDPEQTPGGIIIPDTSTLKGRRNCVGTVINVGNGWGKGKDGKGHRYDMPAPGSRVVYPAVASLPDTQKLIQWRGEKNWFLIHAIDLNLVIETEPGETEPRIE
jgi:co-chaperonin GroES (HSP10)